VKQSIIARSLTLARLVAEAFGRRQGSNFLVPTVACVTVGLSMACSRARGMALPLSAVQMKPLVQVTSKRAEKAGPDRLAPAPARMGLHVEGNRVLDAAGQPLFLHGVGRQGTEYRCSKYGGIFDGPNDQNSIDAMRAWNINAVRVFLNEDCWLGINGLNPADSGEPYVRAIAQYVALLENNGITPILDLQLAAPGTTRPNYPQLPMADRDHSPAFWSSVARTFGKDSAVIFDLYNEPFPDGDQDTLAAWTCWRDGGSCPGVDYPAAGMQELVDAVRAAGADNLLLAAGIRYGNVLTQWKAFHPVDPKQNLAVAWHIYNVNRCRDVACWNATVAPVMQEYPLIATELGEFDCQDWFIQEAIAFLEANGGSYIANAWNAGPGWPCGSSDAKAGPSLITAFSGTPTAYGQGYRAHLLALR
jgi:endoglucanase